eukprot:2120909-Rhodomonas_salina.1
MRGPRTRCRRRRRSLQLPPQPMAGCGTARGTMTEQSGGSWRRRERECSVLYKIKSGDPGARDMTRDQQRARG